MTRITRSIGTIRVGLKASDILAVFTGKRRGLRNLEGPIDRHLHGQRAQSNCAERVSRCGSGLLPASWNAARRRYLASLSVYGQE